MDLAASLEFGLEGEDRNLVQRAQLLADEFASRAREYDEEARFPTENFERLRQEDFLTLAVPRKYGGRGVDSGYPDFLPLLVTEAVATGCASTAWNLQSHYEHCC